MWINLKKKVRKVRYFNQNFQDLVVCVSSVTSYLKCIVWKLLFVTTSWTLSWCKRFIVLISGLNLWNVGYDHSSSLFDRSSVVDINSSTNAWFENDIGFYAEFIFQSRCQIKPYNHHDILLYLPLPWILINSLTVLEIPECIYGQMLHFATLMCTAAARCFTVKTLCAVCLVQKTWAD